MEQYAHFWSHMTGYYGIIRTPGENKPQAQLELRVNLYLTT